MKNNIGNTEIIVRLFTGIALATLSVDQALHGRWSPLMSTLATILLITSVTGFCPLYFLLGIGTSHKHRPHPKKTHRSA